MKIRVVVLLVAIVVALVPMAVLAQDMDPGYLKTFSPGTIAASFAGYPKFGRYDPSQFVYRDGKFFIPGGSTLDLRVFLPAGMTIGDALEKAKKEHADNLKYSTEDFMSFRIWASHDRAGADLLKGKPWPAGGAEVPAWGGPVADQHYGITEDSESWDSAGATWDDLKSDMDTLRTAKKGQKFYVIFSVGYRYKTPGGQMENKWNDVLQKFVPVMSTGMVGYEFGEPLATCTIEVGT